MPKGRYNEGQKFGLELISRGEAAVLFFPVIGFVFHSLLSYVLDIAHLHYDHNVSLRALKI